MRATDYEPIAAYKDNEELLLDDLAQTWTDAMLALYERGCRYLQLDDTTAVRKAGYFVGINAYATDNFMLFDDSIRFVYVPGEIAPKAVNITLDR